MPLDVGAVGRGEVLDDSEAASVLEVATVDGRDGDLCQALLKDSNQTAAPAHACSPVHRRARYHYLKKVVEVLGRGVQRV